MPSPDGSFNLSGRVYGGSATSIGNLMVADGTGFYVIATAANRATFGRAQAIATSNWGGAQSGTVSLQFVGTCDSNLPNVGVGAAGRWVRCSTAGAFEVFTPTNGGSSDVVGCANAAGVVTMLFGVLTETMIAPVTSSAGVVTLEQFGAKGDGVTDDSAALIAAMSAISSNATTYRTLSLGPKTYIVNSGCDVPAGATITGHGDGSVLKSTTGAAGILRVGAVNGVSIRNLHLVGTGTGGSEAVGIKGGAYGVAGSGPDRLFVENVLAEGFAFANIMVVRNAHTNYQGPILVGVRSRASLGYAYLFDQAGEYVTMLGCKGDGSVWGAWVGSGNLSCTSCAFTSNTTGVRFAAGSNDAHGIMSACQINHNATAIYIEGINLPFTLSGTMLYQGDIIVNGANALVNFVGCQVDFTNLTNTGGRLDFANCTFPLAYFASITEPSGGVTTFTNCKDPTGAIPTWIMSRQTQLRTSNNVALVSRDAANGVDRVLIKMNAGNSIEVGNFPTGYQDIYVFTANGYAHYFQSQGTARLTLTDLLASFGTPLGGISGAPLRLNPVSITTSATTTLTAAQYANPMVTLAAGAAAAFTVVLPLQQGAAFDIYNATAFTATIGGATGTTITCAAGAKVRAICPDGANYR